MLSTITDRRILVPVRPDEQVIQYTLWPDSTANVERDNEACLTVVREGRVHMRETDPNGAYNPRATAICAVFGVKDEQGDPYKVHGPATFEAKRYDSGLIWQAVGGYVVAEPPAQAHPDDAPADL